MREPQKIEGLRLPRPTLTPIGDRPTAELDHSRLGWVQLQPELSQPLSKFSEKPLGIGPLLEAQHEVSSPGESHPEALSEPYVNVSAHTAPAREPRRTPSCQCAHNFGSRLEIRATQCVARRR